MTPERERLVREEYDAWAKVHETWDAPDDVNNPAVDDWVAKSAARAAYDAAHPEEER